MARNTSCINLRGADILRTPPRRASAPLQRVANLTVASCFSLHAKANLFWLDVAALYIILLRRTQLPCHLYLFPVPYHSLLKQWLQYVTFKTKWHCIWILLHFDQRHIRSGRLWCNIQMSIKRCLLRSVALTGCREALIARDRDEITKCRGLPRGGGQLWLTHQTKYRVVVSDACGDGDGGLICTHN